MSVILVNHTFSIRDGQGQVNRRLVEALARAGRRVKVITADPNDAFALPWVQVRCVAVPAVLPTPLAHQWFAWQVGRAVRRWREPGDRVVLNGSMAYVQSDVNLCHFVHAAWLASAGHDWAQARSLRSAYQWLFSRCNAAWERLAYRQAGRIVAVSQRVRDDLIDLVGVPASRIEVIPNGLDVERFGDDASADQAAAGLRGRLSIDPSVFVVGFCGDLKTRRKNFDTLLHAAARLPGNCHVVAAGAYEGGPYPAMVESLGLTGRVSLLGRVDDMAGFYRASDAFVGLSHYEPWGLMLAEAMAAGRAVVASRSVGAAGLIRHKTNGLCLPEATDDAALAEALQSLMGSPAWREELGRAARDTAAALDWSVIARRYEALFSGASANSVEPSTAACGPVGELA